MALRTTLVPDHADVLILGGGFAALEAAIAIRIAEGAAERSISIVSRRRTLSAGQDLVYAPFGTYPPELSLRELCQHYELDWHHTSACAIDSGRCRVELESGPPMTYEHLVIATGARGEPADTMRLRTWSDARRLEPMIRRVLEGRRETVMFSLVGDYAWPMPMLEVAQLLDLALRAHGTRSSCDIVIVTDDTRLLPRFGPDAGEVVAEQLRERQIEVLTSLPPGRVQQLRGSINLEAGPLAAHSLAGTVRVGASGFFETDPDGRVADNVFVVGDACVAIYRTAGMVAAQARRIAATITGTTVDHDPRLNTVQMYAAGGSTHLALDLQHPFSNNATTRVDITQSPEPPDHYAGSYLSQIGMIDSTHAAERFVNSLPGLKHDMRDS